MENLSKKPTKGILKSSSSFEQQSEVQQRQVQSADKDIKWDEMNILQTLHPADKDYGHMKVEEPKTPFSYYIDSTDGEHSDNERNVLDASVLANTISEKASELPKVLANDQDDEESDDDENLTEEEKKKKKEFEVKRKMHYNEFQAVKLARKLLEEEDDEEDEAGNTNAENGNQNTKEKNSEQAIDEGIETSGIEQANSEDIGEAENR